MTTFTTQQKENMDISEYILAAQATLKDIKNNSSNTGSTDYKTLNQQARLLKMITISMIAWIEKHDK